MGDAFVTVLAAEGGEDVEGSAILLPAIYDIVWSAVAFTIGTVDPVAIAVRRSLANVRHTIAST